MVWRGIHLQSLSETMRFLGKKRPGETRRWLRIDGVYYEIVWTISRFVRRSVTSPQRCPGSGSTHTFAVSKGASPGLTGRGVRTSLCTARGFSSEQTGGICMPIRDSAPRDGSEAGCVPTAERRAAALVFHFLSPPPHREHTGPSTRGDGDSPYDRSYASGRPPHCLQ
jgi:hypothetical protein